MILHYDDQAPLVWERRHAGNVTCGSNAGRINRTNEPQRVTCHACRLHLRAAVVTTGSLP